MARPNLPPLMQKKTFLRSSEGAIASYNWADIAAGVGYVNLNGTASYNTTDGSLHILSENTIMPTSDPAMTGSNSGNYGASSKARHQGSQGSSTYSAVFKWSPFNLPRVLKGKVIISSGFAVFRSNAGTSTGYVKFTLQKVSGANTTDLGERQTETLSREADGTTYKTIAIIMDLPLTNLKKGDYIQLTCYIYAESTSSSGITDTILYHNPFGADANGVEDSLYLKLPFRIDL